MKRLARVLLRYAWASPATLVGLALAGIAGVFGATARVRKGVVEVAGGRLTRFVGSSGVYCLGWAVKNLRNGTDDLP